MPSYQEALPAFEGYNTQVLGISVDHLPCLKAWAESIGGISYPLLSDFWPHGAVARQWGVFREAEGTSERALFLIDKQGTVRYVDVHAIDDLPDSKELFRVLAEMEPFVVPGRQAIPPAEQPEPAPPPAAAGRPQADQPPVTLYCRPGCIDCRLARRFLDQNGIAYTEINVRADAEAEARVRQWTGGALISPVLDIGGRIIIDFRRAELIEALKLDQAGS